MSILKVVEVGGHGSFYALVSISLAVLLYPYYDWLLPYVSTGLMGEVDATILILAATSVTSGLLYAIPVDRSIDIVVEYKAGHDNRQGRLHYVPVRARNGELFRFVVNVDYLVSAWRAPYWLSSGESCKHAISSAMDDPSVKKEIWSLKNRSGIGFAFLLWGPAVGRLSPDLQLLSLIAAIVGGILLVVPWMDNSSTRLPATVRQVAALRYAQDALSTWRAPGPERAREPVISRLADDARQAEALISDSQWERLGLLYESTKGIFEKHASLDYDVQERLYEIWARAIVEITEARIRNESTDRPLTKYISALGVFKTCRAGYLPQWAEQMTRDDLANLPELLAQPESWSRVDPYYGTFHDVIPSLFTRLPDEKSKVSWLNSLIGLNISNTLLESLFLFACKYTGTDIVNSAYAMFAVNYKLPYREATVPFIDRLVEILKKPSLDAGIDRSVIINVLRWLLQNDSARQEVRERILHHTETDARVSVYLGRTRI